MKTLRVSSLFIIVSLFSSFLAMPSAAFSQKVSEKQITGIPPVSELNLYDVRYDNKSGAFVYPEYDSTYEGVWIVTPKGRSEKFTGANTSNIFIDEYGNSYLTVFNKNPDSTYTYYLLRNTTPLGRFESINENRTARNGNLYFSAEEGGKWVFVTLELATGSITKSPLYEEINFTYMPERYANNHGDPVTYPGFTDDGKPYYVARDSSMMFMVIGGIAQKRYSDIDIYSITKDNAGSIVYIAGSSSPGDIETVSFIVQGDKEYKSFYNVFGPVNFDKDNTPVYIAGFKEADKYPMAVMRGNNEISKRYSAGVSCVQFTPAGKIAFVGSNYAGNVITENCIVIDGKERKQQRKNIYSLTFTPNEEAVYVEQSGTKQWVVKEGTKISDSYDAVDYFEFIRNKLYCIGTNYASTGKLKTDETFLTIGDEKIGPFNAYPGEDDAVQGFFRVDSSGNYVLRTAKLVDKKNYIYEEYVYSAAGRSGPHSVVGDLYLYKGRPIFISTKYPDKNSDDSYSKVYIDLKQAGGKYLNISEFELDSKTGTVSFIAEKKTGLYYVEIKL